MEKDERRNKMESINIEAYLDDYGKRASDYNKNDLDSNKKHLAESLQYIYVTGCKSMEENYKKLQRIIEFLGYTELLILREIPKYRQEEIEDCLEEYGEKIVYTDKRYKMNPKTFGEMDYVEYVLNRKENENRLFGYRTINEYNIAQKVIKFMEENKIKNIEELLNMVKIKKD